METSENYLETVSKNFLFKLENLKCPICLDIVRNVRELPCKHIFCLTCLEIYKKGQDVFACPLCKKEIPKRKILNCDAALDSLCSFVRTLSEDVKLQHDVDVKTFLSGIRKGSTSNVPLNRCESDEIIPQSSEEYKQPPISRRSSVKRPLKKRRTNDSKAASKLARLDIKKDKTDERNNKMKKKVSTSHTTKDNMLTSNEASIKLKQNCLKNEQNSLQPPVDKNKILKWLHDTRNKFDRFSQTQSYATQNNIQDIDMPSVSQIYMKQTSTNKNLHRILKKSTSDKNQVIEERKTRSVVNSPDNKMTRLRRHSLECTTPNNVKQYQNLDQIESIENQLIINIIEDKILDAIDKEVTRENKNLNRSKEEKNKKSEVRSMEEDKFLDQLDNELLENSGEMLKEESSKGSHFNTLQTNKENKSKSSWKSIKTLKKTIGKSKVPKKLDISLQSTQKSTKKDLEPKLNTSDPIESTNLTVTEHKTVDFQKMEDYFSKAIPKMIESNKFEDADISNKDNEANQEQLKDNDSDIYIYQTQPLSKEIIDPKVEKTSYAAKLSNKLETLLYSLRNDDKITIDELITQCPSIQNILKFFNKPISDKDFDSPKVIEIKNQMNFSEKEIQTDMLSFDGFPITPSAAFKSINHEDIGIQTDDNNCNCPCSCSQRNNRTKFSLLVEEKAGIDIKNQYTQKQIKDDRVKLQKELIHIHSLIEVDKNTSVHIPNTDLNFTESEVPIEKILERCKTQDDIFLGKHEDKNDSRNLPNASRMYEVAFSSDKENINDSKSTSKHGANTSEVSEIICSIPQISTKVNRKLMFEKALQERNELEQNLKRMRPMNSDSDEERPPKVRCNRFFRDNLSIEFESDSLIENSQRLRNFDVLMDKPQEDTPSKNEPCSNINIETVSKDYHKKTQQLGDNTQADILLNYCDELIEKANKQIQDKDDSPYNNDMLLSQVLSGNERCPKNEYTLNQSTFQKRITTQANQKIGTQDLLKHYEQLIERAGKQMNTEIDEHHKSKSLPKYSQIPTTSKHVLRFDEDEDIGKKKNIIKTQDLLDHCNSLIAKTTKDIAKNEISVAKRNTQIENDDEFFCENLDKLDSVLEKENNRLKLSKDTLSESLFESCKAVNQTSAAEYKSAIEEDIIFNTPKRRNSVETRNKAKKIKTVAVDRDKDGVNSSDDEIFSDVDVVDTTPQKSISFIERLSCSQIVNQNSKGSLKLQEDSENYPMSMNIVPPPPEFDDDDAQMVDNVNTEQNLPGSERESENVIPNSLSPQEFEMCSRRKPLGVANANSKEFAVPQQVPTFSQQFMKVSPICKEKSRNLNVIEMVRQSKFSPLTILPKSTPPPSMLTSTPKQKSILNYVKPRIKTSQEPSTSKMNEKAKPFICFTRLNNAETLCVLSLCNKNLATRVDKFGHNVTHMIVSVDKNNYVKDHTIKFISAIAAGIWVLNIKWVQECLSENAIVDEEPYEVFDITGIPSPKISRLTRLTNPLLKGFKCYIPRAFTQTSADDVKDIIQLLQGTVVSSIEELKDRNEHVCIIISELVDTEDYTRYEDWLSTHKILTVDINWLSLSVSRYKLLSLKPHLLCSDDSINELGYPSNLIEDVAPSLTQDVTTYD